MDERIRKNPARDKGITLPKRPSKQRRRYLTDDELIRLAYASSAPEHILTLGYVGMRFGESVGLLIENLDFDALEIGIYDAYTPVNGRMVKGDTKTHQSRIVPMPEPLAEMLEPFVAGRRGNVFTSPSGGIVHSGNWRRRVFDPAVKKAQLGFMTPHDLRHTAVSIAVDSGANIMAVAKMCGHEDARETLRTYADLFPDHLEELRTILGARMRRALREQTQLRLVK
jgi:integrase